MPLMHDHEHEDVHCHEHGHEENESSHTDENCLACVFINTYVDYHFAPTIITTPTLCYETPTTEVGLITTKYIATFQSRAPPKFSNIS